MAITEEDWIEDRVLWKVGTYNCKECVPFADLAKEVQEEVLRVMDLRGKPLLLWGDLQDATWTLVTTIEAAGVFEGKVVSVQLQEIASVSVKLDPGETKQQISKATVSHISGTSFVFGAPAGASLFALAGVLGMFPLTTPREAAGFSQS